MSAAVTDFYRYPPNRLVGDYVRSGVGVGFGLAVLLAADSVTWVMALIFGGLFLLEVLAGGRLHPMQYALIGAAMALFYLLLLSLAEVTGFTLAYGIAAALSVGLISAYTAKVSTRKSHGGVIGGLQAVTYGFLYATINAEDHALMLGSFVLFGAVAGLMYLTRNVDWYKLQDQMQSS